jgi:hypothetical protein
VILVAKACRECGCKLTHDNRYWPKNGHSIGKICKACHKKDRVERYINSPSYICNPDTGIHENKLLLLEGKRRCPKCKEILYIADFPKRVKRDCCLDCRREFNRLQNENRRLKLIHELGGCCCKCGFSDWRALQIDHIHGNGFKEREHRNSPKYYRKVLENPDEYQLLCANCNWIKRYENNETALGRRRLNE